MNCLGKITVRRKLHRGKVCLFLFFKPDQEIVRMLLDLEALWSRTYAAWYLVEHSLSLHELFTSFWKIAKIDIGDLEPLDSHLTSQAQAPSIMLMPEGERDVEDINGEKEIAIYDFKKYLKSKGYGTGTIRNYKYQVSIFLFSNNLPLDDITDKEIKAHRDNLIRAGKTSNANHFMCGAKIFFWLWEQKILDVDELEFHRKERKKKIAFIERSVLIAICSYTVGRDFN